MERKGTDMTIRPHMQVMCGIHSLRVHKGKIIDHRYQPSENALQAVGRLEDWLWQELPVPVPEIRKDLDVPMCRSEEIEANRAVILRHYLCDEHGNPRTGDEMLYWNSEWASPRLIGWKLPGVVFANDVVWALVSCHSVYQRTGVHLLPSTPLNPIYERVLRQFQSGARNPRSEQQMLHMINREKQLVRNGQHYPYFADLVPDYLLVASWLFAWVGLRVQVRDLRLMLVVVWN